MRKSLLSLGLGLATSLIPLTGKSLSFVDSDSLDPFSPPSPPVHLNFNIIDATGDVDTGLDMRGFDPATMTVTSVIASFQLGDDGEEASREVKVTFDSSAFFMETWLSGGGVIFSTTGQESVTTQLKALIQADGEVVVDVTSLQGEFTVFGGRLDVEAELNSVPDAGGSLALMGLALCGLAWFKRFRWA